jgi:quinol-cytochrome oxidoreductase complex cytochrome b subunit
VQVPLRTLRWTHTFGLGGSSLVMLVLLALTGILKMLVYQPVPGVAYDSVVTLEREVAFGSLVRGIHYWSANLLVMVVLLHTARVLLTGGHQGPRRFTWVLGAGLLLGVLTASFTGYLLPWDQLSYWAVTISTGMLTYVPLIGDLLQRVVRGGSEITDATLVNFYTLHTTIVPVTILLLAAWHFWRVRRAGGVVVPPGKPEEIKESGDRLEPENRLEPEVPEKPEKVLFWPHLLQREICQALVLIAVICVLATLFGAPLGERANPGMSPNPAKAPWYFVGFQELLIHFHPIFAVLILPLLTGLGFLLLPYLTPDDSRGGVWFLSRRGRGSALLAAVLAVVVTPICVIMDERTGAGTASWITGGLVPLMVLIAVGWSFGLMVRRRPGATTAEAVQAVVVLLLMAFGVLTVIGVWFRGAGMALSWPWTGGGA